MKKIFFYSLTLATVIACNTLEVETLPSGKGDDVVPGMITEIVSGNRGVSSKATISNDDAPAFAWTAGDNVAVHVSNGTTGQYVFTSDPGAEGAINPSASSAKFKVVYPEGYSRDAFAVFPSTIVSDCSTAESNYGQSGHTLNVTLPSSYTLAQVSGTNGITTPCPMIATNTEGTNWEYYQLCGLLRLTVNCIHPRAMRLEIDFDGKNVAGNFSISNPKGDGTTSITLGNASGNNSSVITITKNGAEETFNNNIWKDGLVLNIPLPTGDYSNITVRAYDALSGGNVLYTNEKTRLFTYTASKDHATKRIVSFNVFSVGSNTRVVFAPGNLLATYDKTNNVWTWGFADNQYDYIGNNPGNTKINGNGTLSEDGTVDLFGTSTSINYYGITTSSSTDGIFVDWGTIGTFKYKTATTTYSSDYWFTLSEAEWKYVVGEDWPRRSNGGTVASVSDAHCTKASVNGINGFILFPDCYAGGTPDGVTWDASAIGYGDMGNSGTDGWGATVTLAGWTALENEGCVFFPAAGEMSAGASAVTNAGSVGTYKNNTNHKYLRFNNDGFDSNTNGGTKANRRSVRLAHVVN